MRGSDIHAAYAARVTAERLAQPAVGGCIWCPDFRPEGTLKETSAASLAHREKHHPDARPKARRRRSRPMQTLVTNKSLDENIANARTQGASGWAGP
jgi:hypothetical protein